jgi:F-type H+-transporting ATPase subunit b
MTLLSANVLNALTEALGLAEGGVDVDVNGTAIIHFGLLVVLLFTLKPLLFDPLLKLFEEREKRIDGAKKQARSVDKKSAQAEAEFDAEMGKARAAGNAERERLRAEGVKAENEVLAKVRAETAALLENGRKQAAELRDKARAELQADAGSLGRELAKRALGREV